ncbi:unnamed protein product, partial [Polarella glacialis]
LDPAAGWPPYPGQPYYGAMNPYAPAFAHPPPRLPLPQHHGAMSYPPPDHAAAAAAMEAAGYPGPAPPPTSSPKLSQDVRALSFGAPPPTMMSQAGTQTDRPGMAPPAASPKFT